LLISNIQFSISNYLKISCIIPRWHVWQQISNYRCLFTLWSKNQTFKTSLTSSKNLLYTNYFKLMNFSFFDNSNIFYNIWKLYCLNLFFIMIWKMKEFFKKNYLLKNYIQLCYNYIKLMNFSFFDKNDIFATFENYIN